MTPDMVQFRLKVPKTSVCYMSWTIDAYDGAAFLKNDGDGMVSVFCSPDYAEETERIIKAFKAEGITIERLKPWGSAPNPRKEACPLDPL
ncbi:MAG: hypothetical protein LBU13_03150 [Synergistaceae bacterium]|jgi:hypothetical protein|nr:hypothetical protein [Synergistaceae bacterium]